MTRTLAPLFLVLLTACGPATVDIGSTVQSEPDVSCMVDNDGDGYYYPSTPDCHDDVPQDYDDNDPTITEGPTGNADQVPQSCFYGAAWLVVAIDNNGEVSNDYIQSMHLTFANGYQSGSTENGAFFVDYDVCGQDVKFMTSSLSNEELVMFVDVWVYDANGKVLGTLEPTLADPWVAWDCPSSG